MAADERWEDALGRPLRDEENERLERLRGLWLHYAPSLNLSGSSTAEALAEQMAEALLSVRVAEGLGLARGSWLDVGSGGGLPGLVIAACLPVDIVMVEPRAKRAGFLELALGSLRRTELGIVRRGRLDEGGWVALDGGGALEPGFDVAGARAVFAPGRWLELGRGWASWVFVHGRPETRLDAAADAEAEWGGWTVRAFRGLGTK